MTLGLGYFRDCYAASADPWGLAERWYEARKYAVAVALLTRQRYGATFEPGCSIGVLTALPAPRCDSLLAWDAVPDAVASARARTTGLPGARIEQRAIPGQWPPGSFDLIVLSELLYYFDDADLGQVLGLGVGSLRPSGQLLAVPGWHDLMIAAELAGLAAGQSARRVLGDVPVVVVRDEQGVYVLAERCSHLSGPLSEGDYRDGCLTCPWHGSTFRVSDGTVARGPATAPQPNFRTRIADGTLQACLPGAG
ncbi:MAG: Rieske 2Fe-2S domain-containing protein [Trebonia sp.]